MNAVVSPTTDQQMAEQLGELCPGSRVRLKSCKPTDQNSWFLVTSLIHNAAGELVAVAAVSMPNAIYHHPLDSYEPGKPEVITIDQLADAENIWVVDTAAERITFLPTGQTFAVGGNQIVEVDADGGRVSFPYGPPVTRPWYRAFHLFRIVATASRKRTVAS